MKNHRSSWLRIGLIAVILLSYVNVLASANVSGWDEGDAEDTGIPSKGVKGGVHPWITSQALDYLQREGMIEKGSWFDKNRPDFENLLRWGTWYADNAGTHIYISAPGYGSVADWYADAQTHFYDKGDIYVTNPEAVFGGIIFLEYANTGDLNAPEYSAQLYSRAVEFWLGGKRPLDLEQLRRRNKVYSLGFTGIIGGRQHWYGWGQGTDPEGIGEDRPDGPPRWPFWAVRGEGFIPSVVYLGWSAHLIQDMSVYHHVHRLHGNESYPPGIPNMSHGGYEDAVLAMVTNNDGALASLPPKAKSASSAPDYYRELPVSFDITDLANEVARHGGMPMPRNGHRPSPPYKPVAPHQPDRYSCIGEGYRFSIDIEFRDELNAGQLTAALRRKFDDHGQPLTDNAKMTVVVPGSTWAIDDTGTDGSIPYLVRHDVILLGSEQLSETLNVYRLLWTCEQSWTEYLRQWDKYQQKLLQYYKELERYPQELEEYRQEVKQYQVAALDNAIKATAALIYKFIYEVSEEVYVDPSYAGIEDGSIGHPFNTLSEAVFELSRRPTKTVIKMAAGTYSQPITIDKPCTLEPWSRD